MTVKTSQPPCQDAPLEHLIQRFLSPESSTEETFLSQTVNLPPNLDTLCPGELPPAGVSEAVRHQVSPPPTTEQELQSAEEAEVPLECDQGVGDEGGEVKHEGKMTKSESTRTTWSSNIEVVILITSLSVFIYFTLSVINSLKLTFFGNVFALGV